MCSWDHSRALIQVQSQVLAPTRSRSSGVHPQAAGLVLSTTCARSCGLLGGGGTSLRALGAGRLLGRSAAIGRGALGCRLMSLTRQRALGSGRASFLLQRLGGSAAAGGLRLGRLARRLLARRLLGSRFFGSCLLAGCLLRGRLLR